MRKLNSSAEADACAKAGTLFYNLKVDGALCVPYNWNGSVFDLPSSAGEFRLAMYDLYTDEKRC